AVEGEGAAGPVDVEAAVGGGGAVVGGRQREQFVAVFAQALGGGLEDLAALRESQLGERRAAGAARPVDRGGEVDAGRRGLRQWLLGRRVDEGLEVAVAGVPAAGDEAGQRLHRPPSRRR